MDGALIYSQRLTEEIAKERPLAFYATFVEPVVDSSMRGLCLKPYHAHPQGCPNYGQRDRCPPQAPLLKDAFDTNYIIWALYAEFDIGHHREKQRRKHPTWSERQLVNCRHWQGTVRKFLRVRAQRWLYIAASNQPKLRDKRGFFYTECPEAMGVNITATMRDIGVELEWPPVKTTRMVYLAGVRK